MIGHSHFVSRIRERYNLDLTVEDLLDIEETIKIGKAKLVRSNARGFQYKVRHKGRLILVVLNRSHSTFITALPMNENNVKVNFNGKTYNYMDALYINYQFYLCFNKNEDKKQFCPKCNSTRIVVDFANSRFKCEYCHTIYNFKSLEMTDKILKIDNCDFVEQYVLDINNWWVLFRSKSDWKIGDIIVQPMLKDNSKFKFKVYYNNNCKELKFGYYTIEQLKEEDNGN